jgi:hypothetical protein
MRKAILLFPFALAACGGSSFVPAMVLLQPAGVNPSMVMVTAETQVQFINADTIDHQLVSSNCSELDSPTLAAGTTFTATMGTGPKTCAFADGLQPGATAFQGTVIVDQPAPGYAAGDPSRGSPYGH